MENKLVEINYNKNGNSKKTNSMGMREMQARAFEKRIPNIYLLSYHRHKGNHVL